MGARFYLARRLLLGISLVLMLLSVGCANDSMVVSQAADMHKGLKPAVMTDPQLEQYLQAVGDRIVGTAREMDRQHFGPDSHRSEDSQWMFTSKMKFHFVNSSTLNAFTTGGEHMYVYTELFRQCKSEDELAAVMAHEFAHVYARHVQKGMRRQQYTMGAVLAGAGVGYAAGGKEHGDTYAGAAAGATAIVGQFIGMGYTRGDEDEADDLGFQFYTRAGWDPNRFGDFFQHMIDKGYDTTPEMLSDHPTLKSRVEKTKQRVTELPPQASQWRQPLVASPEKFAELQQHAVEVGKTMPTDQNLAQAQELLAAFPSCMLPKDQPEQKAAQQRILARLKKQPSTPAAK